MKQKSQTHPQSKDLRFAVALALCLAGTATYGQYLPQNVCQPGDPIIASSGNSPGSEGVANAIDGTQAKYLNFDTSTGNNPPLAPSGFIVTPSVGATWLSGISLETANDAPERDPHHFTIEGSNDDPSTFTSFNAGNWTMVADLTIANVTNRYYTQTVYFTNFAAFKSYRWTVLQTATANGCCMQVAEVKLLGSAVPKNVLTPGDPIYASSGNSPGSEGVANAIDGTQAKYLNFDTSTGNNPPLAPSGFAATPSVGATVINGITIETANDAPERDPKWITIEGSNDDSISGFGGGNWELIYTNGTIVNVTNRYYSSTWIFPNVKPYKHYRWTVFRTATDNGCCMQVAEVQLLGSGAQQNVVVPGDSIIASSGNSPGSEGVANAIDGTQAKYLNFDTSTGNNPPLAPSGFVVTPSVGPTVVTGLGIETANDAPERDPHHFTLEGSNDPITDWTGSNWTLIADITIANVTNRYYTTNIYFPNSLPFKTYRWTVLQTATANGCCMQVAEVKFLALTAKADCTKAAFVEVPSDTPVLSGSQATLFAAVNGPWPLQWYSNSIAIPGATRPSFTTVPITTANAGAAYSLAIVGCQTSPPIHAVVFTPSTVQSVGINFNGGGANGAPTATVSNDIAGLQLQAFWNNAGNSSTGDSSITNNVNSPLLDSSNNPTTVTFSWATTGTWGSGVGSDKPVQRLLNGLVGNTGNNTSDQLMIFSNVPAGNHALLVYSVSPPLQLQVVRYSVTNQGVGTSYYMRVMDSDEYKVSPGFYRGVSTDPNNPDVGDVIRFDDLHPAADGTITLGFRVLTPPATGGTTRETGVNAIQLLLNSTNPGSPPAITQQPQPTVAPATYPVSLTVVATGNGLTYQWRKNGIPLLNTGPYSGANTATLTISSLTAAEEGTYSVAVFNQAGSTVSRNAIVSISTYNINDRLAGYWRFNETTGTNAANSAPSGLPASIYGLSAPMWATVDSRPGLTFDRFSNYGFVSNYTKASKAISGSLWVNYSSFLFIAPPSALIKNAAPEIVTSGGASTVHGQFSFNVTQDSLGNGILNAVVGLGPNLSAITGTTNLPADDHWHHVAFTADGAQLRLYMDGKQDGPAIDYTGDINPPDIPWISIGASLDVDTNTPPAVPDGTNPGYFGGTMNEIAIWDRALTSDEIKLLYQAGNNGQSVTNITETIPSNFPATLTTSASGGNVTVSWTPAGGHLEATPTLSPPVWTTIANTNPAVIPTAGNPTRFFRVVNP